MRGRLADVAGVAGGCVIGSVPVGLLMGRALRGFDVRDHGSGSIGTTNVLRVVGPSAAVLTFALDVGKGTAAVVVARRTGADRSAQAAAGLAAVVGHCWPVFARFRGGKGVATAFGAELMLSADASVAAVAGGLLGLGLSRIMSVGSLSAAASALAGSVVHRVRRGDAVPLGYTAAAVALIAVRHSANIRRLARGQEPRVSFSKMASKMARL